MMFNENEQDLYNNRYTYDESINESTPNIDPKDLINEVNKYIAK